MEGVEEVEGGSIDFGGFSEYGWSEFEESF